MTTLDNHFKAGKNMQKMREALQPRGFLASLIKKGRISIITFSFVHTSIIPLIRLLIHVAQNIFNKYLKNSRFCYIL